MKKILIIGDVHSNYPALKAIERYVRQESVDRIINTGDITVYSTFPNETIQWFRKRKKSVSILGNTDIRVLRIIKGKKLRRPKKDEKRVMYFWTSEHLTSGNIKYLKSLPKQRDLTIGSIRIGIFHGTLDDPNEELLPDAPESRFSELAKNAPYRIHIMGHSHAPFYKIVQGVHFINPGSAGRMFDGNPRTSFAVCKISSGEVTVKLMRIPYPIKEVIKDLKKHHLPAIYNEMYLKGKKLN